MRVKIRLIQLIALVLFVLTRALPAGANTVSMLDTSYTVGPSAGPQINSLLLTGPGTLTVDLANIPWPLPLADIRFELVTSAGAVLGSMTGFGEQSFAVSGAGTLFALSCGATTPLPGLTFGYGSYGLDIRFTPSPASAVPLPQTALLLASGLALAGTVRRRERFAIKV